VKIKIPIISKFLNKRARNKLRVINRGYRQLKKEGKVEFPMQLKVILSKIKLYDEGMPKELLCQSDLDIELSARQFLFERTLRLSFNKAILYSVGSRKSLSHPLPKQWRDAMVKQGISVNNFNSAVLWHAYGFLFFGYGILQGLKSTYFLLKKQPNLGKYIYFEKLVVGNVSINPNKHNIVNWYLQWQNKSEKINSICHGVSSVPNFKLGDAVVVQTDGLPRLKGLKLIQYLFFSVYASTYSFICLFFNPIYGFLMDDILKSRRVQLACSEDIAEDYLFSNSLPFYRPFWTYLAEEKGARILFYFYSTNSEAVKTKSGRAVEYPWHLISWPYYLVWDEFQADFIKKFDQHKAIIEEAGHIWFSSSDIDVDVSLNAIAVFDVTPFRGVKYIQILEAPCFYVPKIANQFLNDIQEVLLGSSYNMVHKMKRTNIHTHKKYKNNIKVLEKSGGYQRINPDSDATHLIQKSIATISMPFTSTALIAQFEGRPSIYYDPSGMVQKDDRAAHGIPVLSGIEELKEWVESLNNDKVGVSLR